MSSDVDETERRFKMQNSLKDMQNNSALLFYFYQIIDINLYININTKNAPQPNSIKKCNTFFSSDISPKQKLDSRNMWYLLFIILIPFYTR